MLPILFNLYTEIIFSKVEHPPGLKIGGNNINNLRYANDTVLPIRNEKFLQEILDVVKIENEKIKLLMNVKEK